MHILLLLFFVWSSGCAAAGLNGIDQTGGNADAKGDSGQVQEPLDASPDGAGGARDAGTSPGGDPDLPGNPDAASSDAQVGGDLDSGAGSADAGPPISVKGLPLRTRGRYIVDTEGARVKLASVNWYGASDAKKVVGGLDTARLEDIVRTIKQMGFNSVRLPFANRLLSEPSFEPSAVAKNPELAGLTPLQVYDRVVEALSAQGLFVVLNNHTTHFMWCCNFDSDGLWYTSDHSEDQWVEDWATMAERYRHNPYVIAADLRNEVRIPSDNPLASPTWNGVASDWRKAAERAGNRVLAVNPDLLVVVEGVNFPRTHLQGVRDEPIRLDLPHRLVYAAHNYGYIGPQLTGTKYGDMDWPTFKKQMDTEWGYVIGENRAFSAPVWVSEFGTGHETSAWWDNMVRYLREGDFDFAYWALNPGPKADGGDEPFGLLALDWLTPLDDFRVRDLQSLQLAQRGPGIEPGWLDDAAHHFDVLLFSDWDTNRAEPVADWSAGAYKATCAQGARLVGMAAGQRTSQLFGHTALCSDWALAIGSGARTPLVNQGGDSAHANVHTPGMDWAAGYTKLECPLGELVVGAAQSRTGLVYNIDALLCAQSSAPLTGPCHALVFDTADARSSDVPGDWDPGYSKGQCGLDEYVAGVSLTGGRARGLLCCASQ